MQLSSIDTMPNEVDQLDDVQASSALDMRSWKNR